MIIFGGIHEITRELCDLHAFDFKKLTWEVIFEEPSSPSPNGEKGKAADLNLNETAPVSAIKSQL